ncbi:MAG TPA: response regulator [Microvirga sp.]|jgi:CheY-like chemotaxis protein
MDTQHPSPPIVLLVEDEALLRMFTADILREEAGFKVIEAANADEALTVLEATGRDVRVLVTDVEMPGSMNGFTFTRVVHRAWPHIGLVVVSGRERPRQGDVPEGTIFLPKPFNATALIEAVRSGLKSVPDEDATALIEAVRSGLKSVPDEEDTTAPAIMPEALKVHRPHTGIGVAGGLAQPLPEPDE